MKFYRTLLLTLLITVSAFSIVTYTACTKDPCKDVACLNGGVCANGICSCNINYTGSRCEIDKCAEAKCLNGASCVGGKCKCLFGFEGENCEVRIVDRFARVWKGYTQCSPQPYNIQEFQIKRGATDSSINIDFNYGYVGTGVITSSTKARLHRISLGPGRVLDSAKMTYTPEINRLEIDYYFTWSVNGQITPVTCGGTYDPY